MTRFTGPLKVKEAFSEATVASIGETGVIKSGSAAATGFVVLAQQTTIVSNTAKVKVAQLPEGSDVLGANLFVKTAFGTAAADVKVRVGTSANETLLGEFNLDLNIAAGMHNLTGSAFTSAGTQWTNFTGAGAVMYAAVTAVSGAVASGAEGILTITYLHKV